MAAELSLRELDGGDLFAYKALRDEMLALHPEAFTSDAGTESAKPAASYLARLGADRPDGGHFTLGAWLGERLCGAISCERDERAKVRHIGHIAGMMVRAEARGRGIGRALLAACVERVRAAPGMELLTLSVTGSNAAAIALYRSAGFARYGRLPHAIKLGETYHDKDLMVLMLR